MRISTLALVALLPLAACKTEPAAVDAPATPAPDSAAAMVPTMASATLEPRSGSNVMGTVTFEKTTTGVRVVANLSGLTPGEHGFHVHQNGDCSAPDATSAGDHFNPATTPHGHQTDPVTGRHAGDMGNLTADADGNATVDLTDAVMALDGPSSIVGKAVIVHEKADDFSQPAGNAGKRLACGVVTTAGGTAGAPLRPDSAHAAEH